MHEVIMLQQQVQELHAANQHQKRKQETVRSYFATGGILTGAEGQKYAQEAEQMQMVVEQQNLKPKKQAPPRCSNCNVIGHTRVKCPKKKSIIYASFNYCVVLLDI